jgi:AbrB family looped-hinge helix DNA binding protein
MAEKEIAAPRQSRLSSKGQVTIPIEIRRKLGLEPGDLVLYELEGERVLLRRAAPFDVAFHAALSESLEEWGSVEDDEAFRDL